MNRKGDGCESARRQFLGALATMGVGVLVPSGLAAQARGQAQGRAREAGEPIALQAGITHGRRIDVHHHVVPPTWREAMTKAGVLPDAVAKWSPAQSIEQMDRCGTQTALLSPGQFVWRLGAEGRQKLQVSGARAANEYGAKMVADYPGRFGLFATLPLPEIDATLEEIAYALHTLKAAGFSVPTSWGDKYLGDPIFAPVLEELNRRSAIVHSNPLMPACCADLIPGLSPSPIEYETDQTRMTMSLVVNKVPAKFPNIRFILSHTGGTTLSLIGHFDRRGAQNLDKPAPPDSTLAAFRNFHYDVAGAANHIAMYTAKKVVGVDKLLFGTDFQGQGPDQGVGIVQGLIDSGVFNDTELARIGRENALELLPQFGKT